MSARKIGNTASFQPSGVATPTTQLDLPADAVHVRKNGIEFRSVTPFPVWAEMTVAMQTPQSAKKVNFTGVVPVGDAFQRIVRSSFFTTAGERRSLSQRASDQRLDCLNRAVPRSQHLCDFPLLYPDSGDVPAIAATMRRLAKEMLPVCR